MPTFERQKSRTRSSHLTSPARPDRVDSRFASMGNPLVAQQQALGNQAMQRLLHAGVTQAKLTVGQPGDRYEQEADRVADRVMSIPYPLVRPEKTQAEHTHVRLLDTTYAGTLRRQPVEEEEPYREAPEPIGLSSAVVEEEEQEEILQAKAVPGSSLEATPAIEPSVNAISGTGQSLPASTQRFMESRFGVDFSSVRIYDNDNAAHMAGELRAKAFTIGRDIYFGPSEYQPYSASGMRLLAHELTHVVQQGKDDGPVRSSTTNLQLGDSRGSLRVQRSLAAAFGNFRDSCDCGEDLGNNCAHHLSDALIRSGYDAELDGGTGAGYRRRHGRIVCRSGRPVRARELRDWFAGRATDTLNSEPTLDSRHWAVYQERAADGQGHVVIHSHSGTTYTWRGTGDYPSWRTRDHYTW
jgi:hypothetical protein